MHRCYPLVSLIMAMFVLGGSAIAQDAPTDELKSPDRRYSVKILRQEDSPSILLDDCSIAIYRGDQCIKKFPTFGYLLEAFWSPDGKYVAVNNRRANSGDYVWVFRLHDGKAMAKPIDFKGSPDDAYEQYINQVTKRTATVYPEVASHDVYRLFREAQGWTKSEVLQVKSDVRFWHVEGRRFANFETYSVKDGRLILLSRKINQVSSSKETWQGSDDQSGGWVDAPCRWPHRIPSDGKEDQLGKQYIDVDGRNALNRLLACHWRS